MYFETLKQNTGLNMIERNPCQLLNFGKILVPSGGEYSGNTGDSEAVLVIMSGIANIEAGTARFANVGGRASVFAGKPHAVYLPPNCDYAIKVEKDAPQFEAALALAKADDGANPFLITPDEVVSGKWGISNFSRTFNQILVKGLHRERKISHIIIGETFTPSGNWSTYPPHKHEKDNLPHEVFMEEMYYFKVNPPDGWGLAKHYTDDGSIDDVHTVKDETILKMPKGYHTVVSAPGYTTYYLWFLAGNTRTQAVVSDPNVGWVNRVVPVIKNIEDNLS